MDAWVGRDLSWEVKRLGVPVRRKKLRETEPCGVTDGPAFLYKWCLEMKTSGVQIVGV